MAEKARTSALCFVDSSKSEPQFWKTKQQQKHNCMDIIYKLLLALGEKTTLLRVVTVYILPSWQIASSTLLMWSNSCHHHLLPPPLYYYSLLSVFFCFCHHLLLIHVRICLCLPSCIVMLWWVVFCHHILLIISICLILALKNNYLPIIYLFV